MARIGTSRVQHSTSPLLQLSFAFISRHHSSNSAANRPYCISQQLNHRHSVENATPSKHTLLRRRQYSPAIRLLHGFLGGGAHRPGFWCAPFSYALMSCENKQSFPQLSCAEDMPEFCCFKTIFSLSDDSVY